LEKIFIRQICERSQGTVFRMSLAKSVDNKKAESGPEAAAQHRQLSSVLCGDPEGWNGVGWGGRKVQHGRNILVADSHFCKPEANTIL